MAAERDRAAKWVIAAFAIALLASLALLAFFDVEVQTIDAQELAQRDGDARAFFAGDYVFIALYAVLGSWAQRRFAAFEPGPWRLAPPLLLLGGVVDAVENTLLLLSTGSVHEGRVDAAHALMIPKMVLVTLGALLALLAVVRAVRVLRAARQP